MLTVVDNRFLFGSNSTSPFCFVIVLNRALMTCTLKVSHLEMSVPLQTTFSTFILSGNKAGEVAKEIGNYNTMYTVFQI